MSPSTNLAPIRVWSSVGHGQQSRSRVLQDEIFIRELGSIDAFAPCTVSGSEVSALTNESENKSHKAKTVNVGASERLDRFSRLQNITLLFTSDFIWVFFRPLAFFKPNFQGEDQLSNVHNKRNHLHLEHSITVVL